jgi:hypothetical protein
MEWPLIKQEQCGSVWISCAKAAPEKKPGSIFYKKEKGKEWLSC